MLFFGHELTYRLLQYLTSRDKCVLVDMLCGWVAVQGCYPTPGVEVNAVSSHHLLCMCVGGSSISVICGSMQTFYTASLSPKHYTVETISVHGHSRTLAGFDLHDGGYCLQVCEFFCFFCLCVCVWMYFR